jgi:hypothetical protein
MQDDSVKGVSLPGVRTFQGDMTSHKKPDTSGNVVFTVPKREGPTDGEDPQNKKAGGFGNKNALFDVGRAFNDDRIQEGTIVTDKKRRHMSIAGLANAAFKEWWQATSSRFEETTDKIDILKPKEVPTIRAAETRTEVVKNAASYTKQAPRDDFNKVIGKLRTFQGDAARAAEKAYTVKEATTAPTPTWNKEVEKKSVIVSPLTGEKRPPQISPTLSTPQPIVPEIPRPVPVSTPPPAPEHVTPSPTHTEAPPQQLHSVKPVPPRITQHDEAVAPSVLKRVMSPLISSVSTPTHVPHTSVPPHIPASTAPSHADPLTVLREHGATPRAPHGTKPEKGIPAWTHVTEEATSDDVVRVPDVPKVRAPLTPPSTLRPAASSASSPALDLRKVIEAQMQGKKVSDMPQNMPPVPTLPKTEQLAPPKVIVSTPQAPLPKNESLGVTFVQPSAEKVPERTERQPVVPAVAKEPTKEGLGTVLPQPIEVTSRQTLPETPSEEAIYKELPVVPSQPRQSIPESSSEEVDISVFNDTRNEPTVREFVDPYEALDAEKVARERTEKSRQSARSSGSTSSDVYMAGDSIRQSTPQPSKGPSFEFPIFKVVMITLVVLITGGLGVVTALYTAPLFTSTTETETEDVPQVIVPTYTATQSVEPLPLGGSSSQFRQSLTALMEKGGDGVIQFYPTTEAGTPATTDQIMSVLAPSAPGSLVRALDPFMMIGSVPVGEGRAPFIIMNAHNFDAAFAGMLTWERILSGDLTPFFGEQTNPQETGDGLFKDALRSNRSIRVLRDALGNERVVYAFVNKKLIILTTTTEALSSVITNLK